MVDDVSRREVLRLGLRAGAAAAVASLVPGCGDAGGADVVAGPDAGALGPDAAVALDAAPPAVFGPRPYYVVAHNPNTIAEVIAALDAGANGIEPDINVYADDAGALCISHDEGDAGAPTLVQYLTDLRAVALARPELALVVFDCKPGAVSPAFGAEILAAVRTHLTAGTDLNVIISVSGFDGTSMFDLIRDTLGPREGLMIDEDNDPVAVSDYFAGLGVTNHGFGNGISVLSCGVLGPNVRPSMERACALRAAGGRPRFIYVWTIDCVDLEAEYIAIGVDGMITDDPAEVRSVMARPEHVGVVRLATRADNPMQPASWTYALTIKTADVVMGGTDANVTFTLTGSLGTVSKTIDAEYIKRMERGDTNYLTLQTDDLGDLQTLTVSHDGTGNGPDWYLEWIDVDSGRFGARARATFGGWIEEGVPVTQAVVAR